MRLWSIHPKYLDPPGLVALWREALLAQAVLAGKTRGYTRHPQLDRFRAVPLPLTAIGNYLRAVYDESTRRGYHFDQSRMVSTGGSTLLPVTSGQIQYEWNHLLTKLKHRNPAMYKAFSGIKRPLQHPSFIITAGNIEPWEILKSGTKVH